MPCRWAVVPLYLNFFFYGNFKRISPTGLSKGSGIHIVEHLTAVGAIRAISIDMLVSKIAVELLWT